MGIYATRVLATTIKSFRVKMMGRPFVFILISALHAKKNVRII